MTPVHEEYLKMWLKSVINHAAVMISEIPSSPVITDEFDQCLGRVESELTEAMALIKSGHAINKAGRDD
jgi:hypothetical protein